MSSEESKKKRNSRHVLSFHFFCKRKFDHCNYEEMRKKLGWLSMEQRRLLHSLTMMYKILHGLAPNYLQDMFSYQNDVHKINTWGSKDNQIWIDKSIKSKTHRHSFRYSTPLQHNALPSSIRDRNEKWYPM